MTNTVCNTTEPPTQGVPPIAIEAKDVGVVDSWIRIILDTSAQSRQFDLYRNGESILIGQSIGNDTVVIDGGLQPKTVYTYQAHLLDDTTIVASSTEITLNTMDTTTHDVSFRTDTLGDYSSLLYGVAVVDENDIWVTGEFDLNDSTSQDYNLVHWNGTQWNFIRLFWDCRLVYPNCGGGDSSVLSLGNTISSNGPDDIWLAAGILHHFDGSSWTHFAELGIVTVNRFLIFSSSDAYAVGNGGLIAHFDGVRWSRLQSGTTIDIHDIFGGTDLSTNQRTILCIAYEGSDRLLLQIEGGSVVPISTDGLATSLVGVWFSPDTYYFVVGAGIHEKRGLESPSWNVYPTGLVTSYYTEAIRGTGVNDIFAVGDFMEIVHFNGVGWKNYKDIVPIGPGVLTDVAFTENLVVIGGFSGGRGLVMFGSR